MAGKKPTNFNLLLEQQSEFEKTYHEKTMEANEKLQGLTLKQKKEMIEEENRQRQKESRKLVKKPAAKASKRPEWNFDTDIILQEGKEAAPLLEDQTNDPDGVAWDRKF